MEFRGLWMSYCNVIVVLLLCFVRELTPQDTTSIPGGPTIIVKPSNQTVVEGQRVTFQCSTRYPDAVIYTWFKDGVDIKTTDGFGAGRLSIQNDGSLLVTPAIKTDRGWYLCRIRNSLGNAEAAAYMNVVYKPVVLTMPSQITWARGYQRQIDCPADANPAVTGAVWVRNQEQIISQGGYNILTNGTLVVSNVQVSDAGNYRCTPYNDLGSGVGSPRVQVLVRDPPEFTVSPDPLYTRNVGDSVEMRCEATGTPEISLQWIKDGRRPSGSRVTVSNTSLQIRDLIKSDHGQYECRASNTIATVPRLTMLQINNTTPQAPVNVTVIPDLFNATVSWDPGYDGGAPQSFVVWHRQRGQTDWITTPVSDQSENSIGLYNLNPDMAYDFMVMARNSLGDGSFSDTVTQSTKGYDPDAVNSLPRDKDGNPYYPEVLQNVGPQPSPPVNLTAEVKDSQDIHLTWKSPTSSPVPIFSYRIEYYKDNRLHSYEPRIEGNTTQSAVMRDMPSGTYVVRLRSYGVLAFSPISNTVRLDVPAGAIIPPGSTDASPQSGDDGPSAAVIGGIVGGIALLLLIILIILLAIYCSKKKDRDRTTKDTNRFNDLSHGKPDEVNGRPHEPPQKWDRWQHNGGGDLVTSLGNTDSIFIMPHTRSLDQSSTMRPSFLVDNRDDRDRLYGRRVPDGYGYANELDNGNQRDTSFDRQPRSGSPPPGYGHDPSNFLPPQQQHHPGEHPPMSKAYSFPTRRPNDEQFPPISSQYPSHSAHLPYSSVNPPPPSQHHQPHPSHSSSHPSSPRDGSIQPTSLPPNYHHPTGADPQYPSFQSEDDDVFGGLPQSSGHRQMPGLPRHSSMKPGQTTYLTGDNLNRPDNMFGVEDISSVLDPASEQPSQIHPNSSQSLSPSSHPLYRSGDVDPNNIPGYYVNNGDSTKPLAMVTPSQQPHRTISDNDSTLSSGRPLGYTRDHLQNAVQRLRDAPLSRPLGPPTYPSQPPYMTQSQSNLRNPDNYGTYDSRDSNDSSLQRRKAPYYMSDLMGDPYYPDEPVRPRAHSEGSRGLRGPPYYDDGGDNQDYPRGGRPYTSVSYPDMSLPRQDRGFQGSPPGQGVPPRDPYGGGYDPRSLPNQPQSHPYDYNQPPSSPYNQPNQASSAPYRQPQNPQNFDPRDALPARYTANDSGYPDPPSRYNNYPGRRYGDDTMPVDSASHSSGIGSRNTSHSNGSYHPHRRGSTGKGSMSFSSGLDPDLSLDMSAGAGAPQNHRRDTSADENYEFDSLNALENDIMDDLRRYSRLSGGPGNAPPRGGNVHQDNSQLPPSKPNRYPDSEWRFERLKEEFKQYRQQNPSDGMVPGTTALPIGINGEPLYPMDSEML